jgi:tetratricopeptide (TPR) repeat protein/O-antigen ligase
MSKLSKKSRRAQARSGIAWPEILGEIALIAVVLVVPLVINPASTRIRDVKDIALGVGVALGLSMWLVASLARGRIEWVTSRLNPLVLAFAAWVGLTTLYSHYWYVTISGFGRLAAHVGLYCLAVVSLRRVAQLRRVIAAACLAAVPVCLYGLAQAAGRDPIAWDGSMTRVCSLMGNATYLASFLVLAMPLAVAAGWPRPKARDPARTPSAGRGPAAVSLFFFTAAAMMALCLYCSVTISPVIGLGLGTALALALVLVRGGRPLARAAAPWIAVTVVAGAVLGTVAYRHLPAGEQRRVQQVLHVKDPHGRERALYRRVAFDLFRERPLLGKGYGTFHVYSLARISPQWYADLKRSPAKMLITNHAHNEYLQVLAGTGLVGGAIFLLLLITAYALCLRISLRHPDDRLRRLGLGITVAATAFLFQGFFAVTFRQTGAVTLFWLWLGLLAPIAQGLPHPGEAAPPPRLRQLRFRPLSLPPLIPVGLALLAALLAIGWLTTRQAIAHMSLHRAEGRARAASSQALHGASRQACTASLEGAARAAERSIRLSPYSPRAYYIAAYASARLGDHESALRANQRALELLPGNAGLYYNLGASCVALDRLPEAAESFRRAVDLMPTAARHHAALAEVLLHQNKVSEAAPYAQEAVRLDPQSAECCVLVACVEHRSGNSSDALCHLRNATRLAPEFSRAWQELTALLIQVKQYEEAISAAQEWVRVDPTSAPAHNALGTGCQNVGDYDAARESFLRALAIDPDNSGARLNLGRAHWALGDRAQAARELQHVARAAPQTAAGREAQALLDRMP